MPVRRGRKFWERACREIRGGAKAAEVARRLGVRSGTLQWWNWKLRNEQKAEPAEFLPVVVSPHPVPPMAASLELETNGVRLRVEVGTDVQYVAALVNALRATC